MNARVFPWSLTAALAGFTFIMVLQLSCVATVVPQTKGVPFEQIQKQLRTELEPGEGG